MTNNEKFITEHNSKYDYYSDRITKGVLGFPHRKRLKDLSEACHDYINRDVLDVGCQDLFFDSKIIPYQKSFAGCDLGWENAFHHAKDNIKKHGWNNVYLIKCMGEYLPFPNNLFNMTLCFETLEHVTDENAAVKEINRVSTGDGILVISAPIEFGIILFAKQLFRRIIYNSKSYSMKELFYAGIICDLNKVKRFKHGHKGYDYRNTIKILSPEFKLIKKINTPFKWLPDILSYGVILIFRKTN
ncbi:MAG: methyltransferase domain-containing protein [Candidatus Methanoperedens sp.]|nr:methyltransferase domain-containing protein [Candidatus Methanoperedens sp.]